MVGLGLIANRFAAVLSSLAGVELTAVAARDQSRAESFARRFGASQAFHNYLDVIANPGVDIVYVGLTHNFHYDIVKTCLQHRKAVLCEKPLVTTYRHAAELIDSKVCAVGGGPACMPMAITNSPNTTRSMPTVTPYSGASGAMAKVSHSNGTGIAWIR